MFTETRQELCCSTPPSSPILLPELQLIADSARRYTSVYDRLIACTDEPEWGHGCWCWNRKITKGGYARVNFWLPHKGERRIFTAHILCWLHFQEGVDARDIQSLEAAYDEFRASGYQLDHLCWHTNCLNPDHLEPVSHVENLKRRDVKRKITVRGHSGGLW